MPPSMCVAVGSISVLVVVVVKVVLFVDMSISSIASGFFRVEPILLKVLDLVPSEVCADRAEPPDCPQRPPELPAELSPLRCVEEHRLQVPE